MDPRLRTPEAARIDVNKEDLTTVVFTTGLLEHLMTLAGSTELKAGRTGADYTIRAGKHVFKDPDQATAYRKLFYWLCTGKATMTPAEYAEHASHVLDMEKEDAEETLNLLAEGGMSEFGRKVQEYREERGGKLALALAETERELGHLPRNLSTLQEELQRRTGYEDLSVQEILTAVGDKQRLAVELSA